MCLQAEVVGGGGWRLFDLCLSGIDYLLRNYCYHEANEPGVIEMCGPNLSFRELRLAEFNTIPGGHNIPGPRSLLMSSTVPNLQ